LDPRARSGSVARRTPHHEACRMNPALIALAAALAVAIPALATAWAQSRIGPAIAASMAEKPELSTTAILMIAIPETMVILGFVVSVVILVRTG
jgi:V/A-type H+-transporting ATPase subunit K